MIGSQLCSKDPESRENPVHKKSCLLGSLNYERSQTESNRRIVVLQTSPLPLGYDSKTYKPSYQKTVYCVNTLSRSLHTVYSPIMPQRHIAIWM